MSTTKTIKKEDFEIPRTVFQHLTDDEISRLVAQQKIHANLIERASSRLTECNSNKLSDATERARTTRKKILQHKLDNDTGIPFSITSKLADADQLTLLYKMFKHKAQLHAIKNRKKQFKKHQNGDFSKWTATQRTQTEAAYLSARKRHLGMDHSQTKKQLTPRAPTTKKRRNKKSLRTQRISKRSKQPSNQEMDNMQSLIRKEMQRLHSAKKSSKKKTLVSSTKTTKKIKWKHTQRRIHTARKHANKKQAIARPLSARLSNQLPQQPPTLLEDLLKYSTTKKGGDRLGATLPEFRRSIIKHVEIVHSARIQHYNNALTQDNVNDASFLYSQSKFSADQMSYIYQLCKGDVDMMKKVVASNANIQTKADIRALVGNLYIANRPEWNDTPISPYVHKRNIATLRIPESSPNFESSTRLKSIAYSNVISNQKQLSELPSIPRLNLISA